MRMKFLLKLFCFKSIFLSNLYMFFVCLVLCFKCDNILNVINLRNSTQSFNREGSFFPPRLVISWVQTEIILFCVSVCF